MINLFEVGPIKKSTDGGCPASPLSEKMPHHFVPSRLPLGSRLRGSPTFRLHARHAATRYRSSSPVIALPSVWCTQVARSVQIPGIRMRQRYPSRSSTRARISLHSRVLPFAHALLISSRDPAARGYEDRLPLSVAPCPLERVRSALAWPRPLLALAAPPVVRAGVLGRGLPGRALSARSAGQVAVVVPALRRHDHFSHPDFVLSLGLSPSRCHSGCHPLSFRPDLD